MSYPKIPFFLKEHAEYKYILIILFHACFAFYDIQAQRPQYTITATLNTLVHALEGTISITYTNQSDKTIEKLGIHLWPNAFKVRNSAIVHQKLHQGDLSLYRAKAEDLGGLYDLDFSSPDQAIRQEDDSTHIDIGWILLSKPLMPGESIHITSPYTLIIPKSFSRLGRTGPSYQLTQWYPHIAVFDDQGWNTMPNLDQGEYFNDFADYKVIIRTPENYKIAATGTLSNVKQIGVYTERFYQAENIIDFAWFASPDFTHHTKMVDAGMDKQVELNVFVEDFLNADWSNAIEYAERALKFYSEWLGPYPYPQMTVVHTPFSKAGYMEYPALAQIGYSEDPQFLDRVIAHEIGHTWLYGVLANNEREHPWLDEGFNSYLENEYMHTYYDLPLEYLFPEIVHSRFSMHHFDALQHMVRSARESQPPAASPDRQQNAQYIVSAYLLPAQGLQLMETQLGRDKMKRMFNDYYEGYKFTHVTPEDVRSSFERSCTCDLSWFFDGWFHHAHELDYRIKKADFGKSTLIIKNRSVALLPVSLTEFRDGEPIKSHWLEGFQGDKIITLQEKADVVRLYEGVMAPNKKWWDNIRPRQLIPVVDIVPKIGNYRRPTLALTPVIGYNLADGGLPGVAITTDLLPQPGLKLFAMPMYGIESKKFRFYGEGRFAGDLHYRNFDKFLLGFSAGSFGYNVDTNYFFRDHYVKLSPFVGIRLKSATEYTHVTRWLKYRYVDITQYYGRGLSIEDLIYVTEKRSYGIHEVSFQMSSDTVLQPYRMNASIQAGRGFLRLNLHYNQHFRGHDKMQGVWVHGFLGWLPVFNNPVASVAFTLNGKSSNGFFSRDYMYDEWLLGRNSVEGNISRQIFLKDAGLKTLATIGLSENWMAGAGFSFALPLKVLHVYADAAVYDDDVFKKTTFSYSGGLAIILMKNVFEIYIPVFESREIRESLSYVVRDRWYDRISFQANFKLANPLHLIDRIQYKY